MRKDVIFLRIFALTLDIGIHAANGPKCWETSMNLEYNRRDYWPAKAVGIENLIEPEPSKVDDRPHRVLGYPRNNDWGKALENLRTRVEA
jgi:hypothetical protein